jgi:GAF domain-containing protein
MMSYSVINTALEDKKAILTVNALEDERFAQQASVLAHKLVSIICIPLLLGGTVVGVLYADNRQKPALFTNEFIPILTAFGTQAAIAIANAHLFRSVKNDLQKAKHVIQELSIKIDSDRLHDSVDEIVETDFFRELSDAARQLRKKRKGS